ncbi:MAG TPA: hypothetical protein VEJ87_00710, partial [Acidimicrobiales bacterium]|nr:hypothetical protein [Acidimicrobiales bacterium]
TITGTTTTTIAFSNCTGGNTGGASNPIPTTSLATGGVIPWVDGNTTTIGAPTLTSPKSLVKKCVKLYGAGSSEDSATGPVSASTTGDSPIPGTFSGEVCIDPAGGLHLLKPSTSD